MASGKKWEELESAVEKYAYAETLKSRIPAPEFGFFTDSRDGNVYKTVKIGEQVWLAENLKFKPKSAKAFYEYEKPKDVDSYGYLYKGTELAGVIPEGCHLPTKKEYEVLFDYIKSLGFDDDECAAFSLLAKKWSFSEGTCKTADLMGFGAIPAGSYKKIGKGFNLHGLGSQACFAYQDDNSVGRVEILPNLGLLVYCSTCDFVSVRCIVDVPVSAKKPAAKKTSKTVSKDVNEVVPGEIQYGVVTDPSDGQMYKTVKIGKQVWMAENLRNMDHPADGVVLAPGNDILNIENYGCLYPLLYKRPSKTPFYYECTWDGWKVPEKTEFKSLIENSGSLDALGFSVPLAGSVENKGNVYFSSDTVQFGKTAYLACGKKDDAYKIQGEKFETVENEKAVSVRFVMTAPKNWKPASAEELALYEQKKEDLRKRLLHLKDWESTITRTHVKGFAKKQADRDAQRDVLAKWKSEIPAPQFGVYKDARDGQMYKTVKIGDQVWFAENLRYDGGLAASKDSHGALNEKYGYLYMVPCDFDTGLDWSKVLQAVPEGCRLPRKEDVEQLKNYAATCFINDRDVVVWLLGALTRFDERSCDALGFNGVFLPGYSSADENELTSSLDSILIEDGFTRNGCVRCLLSDPSAWSPATEEELKAFDEYSQKRLESFKDAIEQAEASAKPNFG